MKPLVLGVIAAAAILLPLAAVPAAAQMPGGSYLQSCRDVHVRGDRLIANCRTEHGGWNQTSIDNIGRCAGGIANSDGRLVCGTHGGGFNTGSDSGRNRDRRDHGSRYDREGSGYGSSY